MSKDYKQGSRKTASKGGGSSVLAGLLIGVCLGVAIAVVAAVYLNRVPNPFAKAPTPTSAAEPTATQSTAAKPDQPAPAGKDAANQTASATPPAKDERFDFYKMLPSQGENKQADQVKPAVAPKPADATPPAKVEPPKGYYLQAGAFQDAAEADNLKAKLTMLGMDASIQTVERKDAGPVHRVRVGPLTSEQEVDRVREELHGNGIDPTVVKN